MLSDNFPCLTWQLGGTFTQIRTLQIQHTKPPLQPISSVCRTTAQSLFLTRGDLLLVVLLEEDVVVELGEADVVVLGDLGLVEALLPRHTHLLDRVTV